MASSLAAAIRTAHSDAAVELIKGGKGDFIVKYDGKVIWDKKNDQGRFPEHDEILTQLS